jgi:hypothetical protein
MLLHQKNTFCWGLILFSTGKYMTLT